MLEAEIAFINDLTMLCHFVQATIQSTVKHLLTSCPQDLELLYQCVDPHLIQRLESLSRTPFESMTYDKAIDILKKTQKKWEHSVDWDAGLQTEHERFLAEQVVKGPVFITHYPKHQKPFYMKVNGERVECMDLLIPQVGELVGGSLRESCPKLLETSIKGHGLDIEAYQWYLDLRRNGTTPHGGFGLGIERMMQLVTGMKSVRDVILYPRWFEHCQG
jgi:asparaginyl-tRNA synthetase